MPTDPTDPTEPNVPAPTNRPRYVSRAHLARPAPPGSWIPAAIVLLILCAVVAWLVMVGTGDGFTF
jgi:hypothetical protein